jgi:prophage antirepressor-like protein
MTTKNNTPTIFNFNNHEVRTITDDNNQIWFVANDIAEALGYQNSRKALNDHVDNEDRHDVTIRYGTKIDERNRKVNMINESGMYSLVLSSKKAEAKKFKRWVTSEVLPQIRKTGSYSQTTPTTLAINKRKFLKIEEHNNECYFLTSEFANMFDIDHDELMDKVSVFANTYKNNYSTKYLPHELIVFTARNKKQQAMIHHSVFLLFANQDLAYQSMIIDCITTIDEFYQKQTNKLLDEIIKLKNEFNRASYYVGHSADIINNNLEPAIYFDDNLITTCLKLLKDMKAGLDNDDPDLALVSSCESLVETIIAQNKLQTMQLKNMIEQIQHNIGRSEIEVIKLYNGNAVGWMNTEHNTE